TWNCLTQTSVFAFGPLGTESINVATVATGDMRVMSTGTGTLQLATSARRSNVIYLSAGYEQFGGRVTVNARANGPRTVDVANDFVLRGGTFAVSSASLSLFPSATGGLRIAGDLNLRGGILNITETPAPGSISVTGGVALAEGATLRASGTGTATFNFAQGPTRLYSNLGTVAGPILFSVNGGSTVDFGIYALFGTGTFTLSDGGVAKIGSPDGITAVGAPDAQLGNIRVGTVSPFQRTYSPLATYLYTGTQSQRTGSGLPLEIGTTSATLNAGVLGISTSSAANSVTLSRPARLHGELMLELGQLISSPMAMLTLSTSAVLNPTFPGSADSHVEGVMAREMDETKALYEYPIGDNGDYRPLALRLTNPLGTATYQVEARREPAPNSTSLSSQGSTNVAELLGDTHWLVARAVGTTTAILRIPYDPAITPDLNLLTIAGYNTLTARWENLGLIARNQTDNWVEAEFPTQYSMAMLARAGVDPLPVELIRFAATRRASTVELTWATASEQNSAWFVIERSANGTEFADQARVAAAGNSAKELRYAATDANPLAPTSYYRLRQIDQDGRFTHSDIVAVRGGAGPATALSLYPNPAIDVLTVQLPAAAAGTTVRVVNALGQVVLTRTVEAAASQCVLNIATLPRGSYRVTVLAPGQPTVSQRLVKAAE
ncbi:MAG: T9SS type A sorting domain-containing protein, partial [Hymenobacteraceae bacterium]|nr:T9SS type A sorting domain-containing protein [Hymenobacteraceae bacterium]